MNLTEIGSLILLEMCGKLAAEARFLNKTALEAFEYAVTLQQQLDPPNNPANRNRPDH